MRDPLPGTARIDARPVTTGSETSPNQLSDWLASHTDRLAEYWYREVVRRSAVSDPALRGLLRDFIGFLTTLVPSSVRSDRPQVIEVWNDASTLYGSLGALRGLAAGEVVEEFQIVRDALLRLVFTEGPELIGNELKLREALRINRFLDSGVTQASVGHTDALFFQLLESNGVPVGTGPELLEEIRTQLDGFRREVESLATSS